MINMKKQKENGYQLILIKNKEKIMLKNENFEDVTEAIRQSIIDTKAQKNYVRDYTGEVFELTSDMLVNEYKFNKSEATELAGTAECILQKYSKLLSLQK